MNSEYLNSQCAEGSESDGVDSEDVISSPKDSANKENANCIKPEAPKLNVEPQQMKRKKKLGGYNLRKSLAWDRAFFTEQGISNSIFNPQIVKIPLLLLLLLPFY